MSSYPIDRKNCGYGIQFLKWIFHSGAANEIGPDASALLAAVVTMEDEFHYQRPPNFFNNQLMVRCGMLSEHSFIRARQVAIDAGLLDYTPGKKRTPGRYFVSGFTAQNAAKAKSNQDESQEQSRPSIPNTHNPNKKRPKFVPPTISEVKAYCDVRRNSISAEQFLDHYTANGWVQGKGKPIRDWQAAIRTWERNGIQASGPKKQEQPEYENFTGKGKRA